MKVIAEYDGWEFAAITCCTNEHCYRHKNPSIGNLDMWFLERMDYHKSMNSLYGVTLKYLMN